MSPSPISDWFNYLSELLPDELEQSGNRLPWTPAADGLRNITGVVNENSTATIYAITSTVSGNGDQGADPNQLVVITDELSATTVPTNEGFTTLRTAGFGEVLRGVSFTPARLRFHLSIAADVS